MSQTQTRRSSQVDLLHGPILKSLLLFALPIMASRVFQQIYNTMDTLIVGYTLGDSSIAAMGACSSIYEMMTGFTFGVGNGLAIVTARCFGRQETDRMKKSVASCIVIGVAVTLVVTILATIFMHPLLRLLKTPAEILEESYSYISILSIFLFVMFAYNLCSGLLRAIGNSFMPLVFLIFSSLVNIVLDLLFIRTLRHGCPGCRDCNRHCTGHFRCALPDLYCYESENPASGKTPLRAGPRTVRRSAGAGIFNGIHEQYHLRWFDRPAAGHQQPRL